MPHPAGGSGARFTVDHSFNEAYAFVGKTGMRLLSTAGELLLATRGVAKDGVTITIVFGSGRVVLGSVCASCWGYGDSCGGSSIGHCSEGLDRAIRR